MAYFSNGTEGASFEGQCSICKYGDKPCPIALLQFNYNYDQIGNDLARKMLNDLVKDSGECAMFTTFKDDFFETDVYEGDWPKITTLQDKQKQEYVRDNWDKL